MSAQVIDDEGVIPVASVSTTTINSYSLYATIPLTVETRGMVNDILGVTHVKPGAIFICLRRVPAFDEMH
jgi:phosphoglycerate dehydrogenase-like enzyme